MLPVSETMEAGSSKGTNYVPTAADRTDGPVVLHSACDRGGHTSCFMLHSSFPFETNASAFLMHAMNDHPGLAFILCTYYA